MRQTLIVLFVLLAATSYGQTTEFTYQGNLTNAGNQANGNFDFEFRLFDAPTGGSQTPNIEVVRPNVPVVNGLFTVSLDFGNSFPGPDRWLEIRVRTAGGGGFTILDPRQKLGRTPYAIQSLTATNAVNASNATNAQNAVNATNANTAQNSLQLGGVAANQYVVTTDPRMSDPRPPTAGSANYIQNTSTVQASTNFNISGTGRANTLSATQYNIGGSRVLGFQGTEQGGNNFLVGIGAGFGVTSGVQNTILGSGAAQRLTTGSFNAFFGHDPGTANVGPIVGDHNSAFGRTSGFGLTSGSFNSFFGGSAGSGTSSGESNTFVGFGAGGGNNTGSYNTSLGAGALMNSSNLSFATAIGAGSRAALSDSIYLGRAGGEDTVRVPGGIVITGTSSFNGTLAVAGGASAAFTGPVFISGIPGSGGTTTLCRNAQNQLSLCSSSLRYKENVAAYTSGLDLLRRLRPVSFNWIDGGMLDLGLVAEDVAAIEPLLTIYNDKEEVEGVKYDRIGVVLVNAVKEQQKQIDGQRAEIEELRRRLSLIDELRRLVCITNPAAELCEEKK